MPIERISSAPDSPEPAAEVVDLEDVAIPFPSSYVFSRVRTRAAMLSEEPS